MEQYDINKMDNILNGGSLAPLPPLFQLPPLHQIHIPKLPNLPPLPDIVKPLKQLPPIPLNVPAFPNFNNTTVEPVIRIPSINLTPNLLHKLNHAANVNPIKTLLKESKVKLKSNHTQNVVSIITGIFAFIALIIGIISLFYVLNKTPSFSSINATGTYTQKSDLSIVKLNTHYVCVPGNNQIILTLPDPNLNEIGQFVSASLPIAFGDVPDSRSLTLNWTNDDGSKNLQVPQNTGALIMIARELGFNRWKVIRTWP